MRVVARRTDGFAHEVDMEGGHTLIVDEPQDCGGTDTGPRPRGCSTVAKSRSAPSSRSSCR